MWLASISLRDKQRNVVATGDWSPKMMAYAQSTLQNVVLKGIGDAKRQRCFRMNITCCIHRGLTAAERRGIPTRYASHLAGAPVEVLWNQGAPDVLSAQPCANPRRHVRFLARPDLWVPLDCGACASCLARRDHERQIASMQSLPSGT